MYSSRFTLSADQKQYISSVVMSGRNRDPQWRLAAALALSKQLSIQQTEDPSGYYNGELYPIVRNRLSALVEVLPFDLEGMTDLIEQFWHGRYNVAFGQIGLVGPNDVSSLASALGLTSSVPRAVQQTFQVSEMGPSVNMNQDLRMVTSILRIIAESETGEVLNVPV